MDAVDVVSPRRKEMSAKWFVLETVLESIQHHIEVCLPPSNLYYISVGGLVRVDDATMELCTEQPQYSPTTWPNGSSGEFKDLNIMILHDSLPGCGCWYSPSRFASREAHDQDGAL